MSSTRHCTLPRVQQCVDVYWPDCERYFRGRLRDLVEEPFTFLIHYDDGDVLITDLNTVRWHRAKGGLNGGGCCEGEQEVLLEHDYKVGDLGKILERKQNDKRKSKRTRKVTQQKASARSVRTKRERREEEGEGRKRNGEETDCDTAIGKELGSNSSRASLRSDPRALQGRKKDKRDDGGVLMYMEEPIKPRSDELQEDHLMNGGVRELTHPAKQHWKKQMLRDYMWVDSMRDI